MPTRETYGRRYKYSKGRGSLKHNANIYCKQQRSPLELGKPVLSPRCVVRARGIDALLCAAVLIGRVSCVPLFIVCFLLISALSCLTEALLAAG